MDQEKLEKCLEEVRANCLELKKHHNDIEKTIENYRMYIPSIVEFIQNCDVKVKKPSVLRIPKCYWSHGKLPFYQNLFIRPCVELSWKDKCIPVCTPLEIDEYLLFTKGIFEISVPHSVEDIRFLTSRVFSDEISHIKKIREILGEEFSRCEREASEIIKEFRGRRSIGEKRRFQIKLVRLFDSFPGLVEVPPNILLAFMSIDDADTHALEKFAKRNRADVFIADEEDIVEAQNLGKTKKILEG